MDDNQNPTTEPTPAPEPATPEPQTPEAAAPEPEAAVPAWVRALEEADAKELRRHPKFAGILGSELERERRSWAERQQQEAEEKARKDAEEQLLSLAKSDPVAFAERYLAENQQEALRRDLEGLRSATRADMARAVGRAYQGVPEWVEFTEREYEELSKAIAGKPDDEALAAWNAKALELVADKRANKRFEERFQEWKEKELSKEREALRKEVADELRKQVPSPDLARPRREPPAVHPLYQRLMAAPAGPEYDAVYEEWRAAGMPTTTKAA